MVRHIAGIAEIVEDFEAGVAFYRDALGLEVEVIGDGYATVKVAGTLHFGIWARSTAAEATYGSADAAERVPLGFSIGFEVDDVGTSAEQMADAGANIVQPRKVEPWQQVTSRFVSPSEALCEIAETPWARRIDGDVTAGE